MPKDVQLGIKKFESRAMRTTVDPRAQHGHRVPGSMSCALHSSCASADAHGLQNFRKGQALHPSVLHCSVKGCVYCAALQPNPSRPERP